MALQLTLFPCLPGICLVSFLFQMWLFIVLSINFRVLFHLRRTFTTLCKVATEPYTMPGRHWVQTIAEFIESYKILQNLSNCTKYLIQRVNEVWAQVPQDYVHQLYASIPRRLQAVKKCVATRNNVD